MNRAVFSMGAFLSILAMGGIFFFGQVVSPPPVLVMAARVDLPVGAALTEVAATDLVTVPLRGDPKLLSSLVTEAEYARLRDSGGVLLEPVRAYEPIRKSAVVSDQNDAAARLPALQLADPNLMIVRLVIADNAPEVQTGDLVDLSLAVQVVQREPQVQTVLSMPPVHSSSPFLPAGMGPGEVDLPAAPTASPTPTLTPTLTPTPALLAPLAKTIVHAAVVTHVVREQPYASASGPGTGPAPRGKITAIDVVIPRQAFEVVTLAAAAGNLQVGLLSPLADRQSGPTLGASLSDFLAWFYADRAQLAPSATPTPTATVKP